jgi:pilus assembly protein CpaE
MAKAPQVLIVEQDGKARFEVKQLAKQANLVLAGEAALGTEAVSLAAEVKPDVILVGIGQPPGRATKTIEGLLDILPETPIVAYAWTDSGEVVTRAMQAGARDFFVMPASAERLQRAVVIALEAEERRRLRLSGQTRAFGPQAIVVSIFGAKGGVGKSTVAVNLGVALSKQMEQNVVLVDADNAFGDVASMLELTSDKNFVDLGRGIEELTRANVTEQLVQHNSGLWVLPAPKDTLAWHGLTPERLHQVLALLSQRFDIVLVDTAGVINELTLAVLNDSSVVLWVTSPDFSSVKNSLLGLETLQRLSYPESKIRIVLNHTSSANGVRPDKVKAALSRDLFWVIPYDYELHQAGEIGRPAVLTNSTSRGARNIVELAGAVTGVSTPEPPKRGIRSILRGSKRAPEAQSEPRSQE